MDGLGPTVCCVGLVLDGMGEREGEREGGAPAEEGEGDGEKIGRAAEFGVEELSACLCDVIDDDDVVDDDDVDVDEIGVDEDEDDVGVDDEVDSVLSCFVEAAAATVVV